MVDCYMSWDAEVTTRMADILSEYNLYWYEDVLTPDDLGRPSRPARGSGAHPLSPAVSTSSPTSGLRTSPRAEALGLWQPDITWCGGITAGLRIIDLARAAGIPVSPHRGAEVWGLHLIAASDWADFAEYHSDHIRSPRDVLWLDEPEPENGFIAHRITGLRVNRASESISTRKCFNHGRTAQRPSFPKAMPTCPALTAGPLSGLTFAAKDIFDIAGHVTGCGNPHWLATHGPAEANAWVVQRLVDAGAAMVGKTITDELTRGIFGENMHYGTPVNPRAPGRVPGGLLQRVGVGRGRGFSRLCAGLGHRRLGARAIQFLWTVWLAAYARSDPAGRHAAPGSVLRHHRLVRPGCRDLRAGRVGHLAARQRNTATPALGP